MNDIMTFRRKQIEEEFDKEIAAQKENKLFYLAKQTQKKKDKWIARGRTFSTTLGFMMGEASEETWASLPASAMCK